MSRRLFSTYLPQGISNVAREIRMLTSPYQPSASEIRAMSPLHLPDVWSPSQYLISMGFRPALARRLSSIYMDIIARYRQVFDSYFRRAIQGNCHHHPEHYCDIFVVQFKGTIQVLESQFMSAAWVWLCRAGLFPTQFWPRCIDVRVDAVTKAHILSRLSLKTTSFIMDATSSRIGLPEEECKTEGFFLAKTLPASVPFPLRPITPSTCNLFHLEKSSSCFPACYPPPPSKQNSSPEKTLVTQLKLKPPAKNDKPFANRSVNVSSLLALFGKMSVATSEAGFKTQKIRKYAGTPRSEPSSLVSPVAVSMSSLSPKPEPPNTEMASSAKSTTKPRKRKIAALPRRHIKTAALPAIDPSLPPTANQPVSRTPSLISDTSSCSDSFSSSDELDTPPSTPPSHSHVLIACNTLSTSDISYKSTTGPFRLPILRSAVFLDPRKEEGIHIDLTNGKAAREQLFSFTFGA